MYITPQLERYGRFRDLTLAGCINDPDGYTIKGVGSATGQDPKDPETTLCLGPEES